MLSAIKHGSTTVRVYSNPQDAYDQLNKIASPEDQQRFNLSVKEVGAQHMDVCTKYTVIYNKETDQYSISEIRGFFSQSRRWPARVYNELHKGWTIQQNQNKKMFFFHVAAYSHEEAIQLTKDYIEQNAANYK